MEFVFVTPRRWAGKTLGLLKRRKKVPGKTSGPMTPATLSSGGAVPARPSMVCQRDRIPDAERPLARQVLDRLGERGDSTAARLAVQFGHRGREAQARFPPREGAQRSTVVAADSTDEALAFVAQCFGPEGSAELEPYRYQILVFDKAGVLPKLAGGTRPFIPVVHSREVELELAPYAEQLHSIVVSANSVNAEPDIVLEPVSFETFDSALKGIGKNRRDQEPSKRVGMLTDRPAPPARDRRGRTNATLGDTATRPGEPNRLHAGRRGHALNETDMAGLSLLAGERAYEALEKDFQRLIQLNDSPLWSIGTSRVVSKIDLLYAIARYVTRDDLKRYFDVARMVLGEDDPSLDLAEDQRWAASIHGKTRNFLQRAVRAFRKRSYS